jgi:hypothetical protein
MGGLWAGRARALRAAGSRPGEGYRYPDIRRGCREARVRAIIPTHSDQPHAPGVDRRHQRKRNRIERLIGRLKQCRRVATRYEKLGQHSLGMVLLAAIQPWL